jgi:ParB-like chromosome segregation protein Spo0J
MKPVYPDLLPPLDEEEFRNLKDDIARRGVKVAIEVDEATGNILDGFHRHRACQELGITDFPTVARSFASEAERRWHAVSLNILGRKSLSKSQIAILHVRYQLPGEEAAARERMELNFKLQNPKQRSTAVVAPSQPSTEYGRAAQKVAKKAGVSSYLIVRAKRIEKESPEHSERILAGEITIEAALKELGLYKYKPSGGRGLAKTPRPRYITKAMRDDVLLPFIEKLYDDLVEKRRAQRHAQLKRNWNHEGILKKELMDIIDWVEKTLFDRVKTFTPRRSSENTG